MRCTHGHSDIRARHGARPCGRRVTSGLSGPRAVPSRRTASGSATGSGRHDASPASLGSVDRRRATCRIQSAHPGDRAGRVAAQQACVVRGSAGARPRRRSRRADRVRRRSAPCARPPGPPARPPRRTARRWRSRRAPPRPAPRRRLRRAGRSAVARPAPHPVGHLGRRPDPAQLRRPGTCPGGRQRRAPGPAPDPAPPGSPRPATDSSVASRTRPGPPALRIVGQLARSPRPRPAGRPPRCSAVTRRRPRSRSTHVDGVAGRGHGRRHAVQPRQIGQRVRHALEFAP